MKSKVFAAVSGIIAAAILFEGILILIGMVHKSCYNVVPTMQSGTTRIMCLGDSFTEGAGAIPAKSYPRQLQELLRNTYPHRPFSVLNLGRSGTNTTVVLRAVQHNLYAYKPQFVVLLTGGNNLWNYRGYAQYKEEAGIFFWIRDLKYRIHIKTFFDIVSHQFMKKRAAHFRQEKAVPSRMIRDKLSADKIYEASSLVDDGNAFLHRYELDKALKCFRQALGKDPRSWESYMGIGMVYKWNGNYAAAAENFRKSIQIQPTTETYFSLGDSLLGAVDLHAQSRYAAAIHAFGAGISLDPLNTDNINYIGAILVLEKADSVNGNSGEAGVDARRELMRTLNQIRSVSSDNPELKACRAIVELGAPDMHTEIRRWIDHDITAIIACCKKANVEVIVMGYPNYDLRELNSRLKNTAAKNGVVYVDNERIFTALVKNSSLEKYFVLDGHCNADGYGVMAANAAAAIGTYMARDASAGKTFRQ